LEIRQLAQYSAPDNQAIHSENFSVESF